jgi:hypothetical protein
MGAFRSFESFSFDRTGREVRVDILFLAKPLPRFHKLAP